MKEKKVSNIEKNSEILFIYDAKLCNPNGDMDNENKPRMDYDTDTNLVSDVRLKRYIRDYYEKALNKPIFVTENAKDAKERGAQLKQENKTHKDLIDCKLFGAVFAEAKKNDHYTGPIQFNWGYSLNPVEISETSTITSSFSSGEGIGKDFRVKYSLIAFSGGINVKVAESVELSEEDVTLFDKVIINAIPFNRTRSKIGQTPRIYLRVEFNDNKTVLKDLREYINISYNVENKYSVRSLKDLNINFNDLNEYLEKNNELINKIFVWIDDNVNIENYDRFNQIFKDKIENISPIIKA